MNPNIRLAFIRFISSSMYVGYISDTMNLDVKNKYGCILSKFSEYNISI
jgi:hypothetical protein